METRFLKTFRSFADPLRSGDTADRWIAGWVGSDALAIQKKTVDAVGRIARAGALVPDNIEGLFKVDARVEAVLAQLTSEYIAGYERAEDELRLWQAVFDLAKVFIAAYQSAWYMRDAAVDKKRWRDAMPLVAARLMRYRYLDGKLRLFRFSHWTPAQWRELHELYETVRSRGWHERSFTFGVENFSLTSVSVEQEYIKALLLMRLDSGNFTADQVDWIADQLSAWSASLTLLAPPASGAEFMLDPADDCGLTRRNRAHTGGRVLFLDTATIYTRVVEQVRSLPEPASTQDAPVLPIREQRLLLLRLASLFGPEALAIAPRAARVPVDTDVRVIAGLKTLCERIGESQRASDALKDDAAIEREVADVAAAVAASEGLGAGAAGSLWKMTDRSASGCRLTASLRNTSMRLNELLAIREGDDWSLGVVRRMQRNEREQWTLGVEIIARRFVRVLLRRWSGRADAADSNETFFGIYVAAHSDNRESLQRTVLGPGDKLADGLMGELQVGSTRYAVRFTETLERQPGWAWARFNPLRKLSTSAEESSG